MTQVMCAPMPSFVKADDFLYTAVAAYVLLFVDCVKGIAAAFDESWKTPPYVMGHDLIPAAIGWFMFDVITGARDLTVLVCERPAVLLFFAAVVVYSLLMTALVVAMLGLCCHLVDFWNRRVELAIPLRNLVVGTAELMVAFAACGAVGVLSTMGLMQFAP